MTDPAPSDLDTWADTLHQMNTDPGRPPANLLTVPCPQCGMRVQIVPDGRITVGVKPEVAGPGWASVRLSVTASGSAVHTHSVATP